MIQRFIDWLSIRWQARTRAARRRAQRLREGRSLI
jgi:hypothetical protein